MKKSEVKQLFLSRGKIAEDIMETYFLIGDTPINLGSKINCCGQLERTMEHNSCFDLFKCKEYEWNKFFKKTGAIGICPETKTAFCIEGQKLTKKQLQFIKDNKLELINLEDRWN